MDGNGSSRREGCRSLLLHFPPRHAERLSLNFRTGKGPILVTYREEAGGKLWFPTYSKADEFLAFPKGEVHVREVVKYSSYKPLDSRN